MELGLHESTSKELRKKLDSALPDLYAAVLVYSAKAEQYFKANSMYIQSACM